MTGIPCRSVTTWDAIMAKTPVITLSPGSKPRGAVSTSDGVYLRMGDDLMHLAGSEHLASRLFSHSILIILEADAVTCRMTRIPNRTYTGKIRGIHDGERRTDRP